jgi:DNA end-binding protein Ku
MPRAVWTGSLAFGLVSIPVALFPATESKDVRFHLIDPDTGQRVRYRRVVDLPVDEEPTSTGESAVSDEASSESSPPREPDEVTARRSPEPAVREVEVDYGRLVRGFEIEQDRYAIVQQEEIERIRPTRSTTIDVEHFVRLDDIDPVFFEKSYFLTPRGGADRPYLILQRALESTGLAGVGRFVLRTKPHLVAIRPARGVLGLETLYFADEVRAAEAIVDIAAEEPSTAELRLAEQLVDVLAQDWEPSQYGDEYREGLLRLIEQKTPVIHEQAAPVASAPGIDELMSALKQSVEEAKRRRSEQEPRRAG